MEKLSMTNNWKLRVIIVMIYERVGIFMNSCNMNDEENIFQVYLYYKT